MRLSLLALLALLPVAVLAVPIPFYDCGNQQTDHIKIGSASSSVWPPVPGQNVTIDLQGALDENLNGGTYTLQVSFDGFPVVNQQGALRDIANVTWPIAAGPINILQTVLVPTFVPAGSNVVVNASALDSNGQELMCVGLAFTVPSYAGDDNADDSADDADDESDDDDVKSALYTVVDRLARGRVSMKQIAAHLLEAVSGELKRADNSYALEDATPVPFTNCGSSGDEVTVVNITSTEWPPVLGSSTTIVINLVANEVIQDGSYVASVSFDGIPLVKKSGDISKYFALPIQQGPVTMTKTINLPNLPLSGSIAIQINADDNDSNELFCLQLAFNV